MDYQKIAAELLGQAGGTALAVALKTRDHKLKSMALPASLSAFMGITEPAIFGVNLCFLRPFIAGSIGGACGTLYASIVQLGATGTGVTGIFGVLLHLHGPLQYLIAMGIATGVAFVLSWILGVKTGEDEPASAGQAPAGASAAPQVSEAAPAESGLDVCAPITGKVVPLTETGGETFASGVLGQGAAIIPAAGYPIITQVIVTNADDFASVEAVTGKDVQRMDALLAVRK